MLESARVEHWPEDQGIYLQALVLPLGLGHDASLLQSPEFIKLAGNIYYLTRVF